MWSLFFHVLGFLRILFGYPDLPYRRMRREAWYSFGSGEFKPLGGVWSTRWKNSLVNGAPINYQFHSTPVFIRDCDLPLSITNIPFTCLFRMWLMPHVSQSVIHWWERHFDVYLLLTFSSRFYIVCLYEFGILSSCWYRYLFMQFIGF